ncbi:hypothetical protein CYMTET_33473 [Cymbomonas tetramitiformis]|uniref:Uncharacterized protein n=1 Tax=Cymbomonas tetramitiformis TaxID=36881 RepID=A0AAE0FD15_9CHLO|nr:hypothetical protein CYMTET_33473 [Cymbomonas tetramitiformis]
MKTLNTRLQRSEQGSATAQLSLSHWRLPRSCRGQARAQSREAYRADGGSTQRQRTATSWRPRSLGDAPSSRSSPDTWPLLRPQLPFTPALLRRGARQREHRAILADGSNYPDDPLDLRHPTVGPSRLLEDLRENVEKDMAEVGDWLQGEVQRARQAGINLLVAQVLFVVALLIMKKSLAHFTPETFAAVHALFSLPLVLALAFSTARSRYELRWANLSQNEWLPYMCFLGVIIFATQFLLVQVADPRCAPPATGRAVFSPPVDKLGLCCSPKALLLRSRQF